MNNGMQVIVETLVELYHNSYGYTVQYEATIMADKGDYDTPPSVEWDYVIVDVEREHNSCVGVEQVKVEDLDEDTLAVIDKAIDDDIDSNWEKYLYN
jgi:hypothetical protein